MIANFNPNNEIEIMLVRRQFATLFHGHKCIARDQVIQDHLKRNLQPPYNACTLPQCAEVKQVLAHLANCDKEAICLFDHCTSSRHILAHWRDCTNQNCRVCYPIKKYIDDNESLRQLLNLGYPIGSREVYEGFNKVHSFGTPPMPSLLQEVLPPDTTRDWHHQVEKEIRNKNMEKLANSWIKNSDLAKQNRRVEAIEYARKIEKEFFNSSNSPEEYLEFMEDEVNEIEEERMNLQNGPLPTTIIKDWHCQVDKKLREHIIGKVVRTYLPVTDLQNDQNARTIEKECFESANDREEYYHKIADKIYKIGKELQENKATSGITSGIQNMNI